MNRMNFLCFLFLKQFITSKPISIASSNGIFCDVTGYCYNADVYESEATSTNSEMYMNGLGIFAMLNKIRTIYEPQNTDFFSIIFI